MVSFVIKIYNILSHHKWLRISSFMGLTAIILLLLSHLNYKEDIADFLPLDKDNHKALTVFQDISGANRIFAIFQYRDTTKASPEEMTEVIEEFVARAEADDSARLAGNITAQIDLEKIGQMTEFVYSNIAYFLTPDDYLRIDSLLAKPGYIRAQLQNDRNMLMFPTGSMMTENIGRDPLNLFIGTTALLQKAGGTASLNYETHDGYIFSPDMKRAIVMIDSPFGSSETEKNTQLVNYLQSCADSTTAKSANIDMHLIGGPVIAVGNSSQIKYDSILSVSIALVLILSLLIMTFRNVRNLLLICVSIGWGWLFALGGLALFHDSISVIVIGISSVILGIAVNYPLHFIAHLRHTPDKRKALREIAAPLVVGNITTVGAFLALVPLQSVAMRDLGLFASFLLVGTILFVLLFLPHVAKTSTVKPRTTFIDKLGNFSPESKPWLVRTILVLTVVFAYFSLQTKFDANISHINYMTPQQHADMEYFQKTMSSTGARPIVYAVSSGETLDAALDSCLRLEPVLSKMKQEGRIADFSTPCKFVPSKAEQHERLRLWNDFLKRHDGLLTELYAVAKEEGFAEGSFEQFENILSAEYTPHEPSYFKPIMQTTFAANFSIDSLKHENNVVNAIAINHADDTEKVENELKAGGHFSFDVANMNSAIANRLSDDFNYIGWACGLIVFFFLWLSLGSIELATLSFVPMAVSWLWILGIMSLLGIQFNIVNVILATFIFGQGDDYTIFMTEGACYEYAYRRKMLASYKHSIIVSALIMFIGIGTLIVAKHPALRSLAQVTIAGMFSVVLMAYIFPPLIFNLLVRKGDEYRQRPLSLVSALRTVWFKAVAFCLAPVAMRNMQRFCSLCLKLTPGISVSVRNALPAPANGAVLAVSQRRSWIDKVVLLSLGYSVVCQKEQLNRLFFVLRLLFIKSEKVVVYDGRWLADDFEAAVITAKQRSLDIATIAIHGSDVITSEEGMMLYDGVLTVKEEGYVSVGYNASSTALRETCHKLHTALRKDCETAEHFRSLVTDRYRYKGAEVFAEVKKNIRQNNCFSASTDNTDCYANAVVVGAGYGEFAMFYALRHASTRVLAVEDNGDKADIMRYSAADIAPNLQVLNSNEAADSIRSIDKNDTIVFLIDCDSPLCQQLKDNEFTNKQKPI